MNSDELINILRSRWKDLLTDAFFWFLAWVVAALSYGPIGLAVGRILGEFDGDWYITYYPSVIFGLSLVAIQLVILFRTTRKQLYLLVGYCMVAAFAFIHLAFYYLHLSNVLIFHTYLVLQFQCISVVLATVSLVVVASWKRLSAADRTSDRCNPSPPA